MVFHSWIPAFNGVLAIALTFCMALSLQIIGAAIGGAKREPAIDLLIGWSALCVLYFVLGTLTSLSFLWIDAILVFAIFASFYRIRRLRIPLYMEEFSRYVALALPFMLVAVSIEPTAWDELTHWLPNVHYLLDNHHFPGKGLPESFSSHAGYPYGVPLIYYIIDSLAKLLGYNLLETGVAPVFNLLLLVSAARMVITLAKEQRGAHYHAFNPWTAAALGLLAVTALCPTFVPIIVLSAYADNATAVTLLALAFGFAARQGRGISARSILLLLALAVCLKEDNALQVALLLAGVGLWQWRSGERFARVVVQMLLLCVPMLMITALWHIYAAHNIPGGEMGVRPMHEWRFDLIGQIAYGFLITALHKSGYYVLALGITGYSGWRLMRNSKQDFTLGTLCAAFTALFLGYNLFLFYAYISIFSPAEGVRVASLWRYNTHLGLLEVAIAFLLLARVKWILHYPRGFSALTILIVVTAPFLAASKLRFDQTPLHQAVDVIAHDIAAEVPKTSHIVLLDMNRNGFDCVMIDHTLGKSGQVTLCMSQVNPETDLNAALTGVDYIWVDGWPDVAQKTLKVTLPADHSHLLKRNGKSWKEVHNWALLPQGK